MYTYTDMVGTEMLDDTDSDLQDLEQSYKDTEVMQEGLDECKLTNCIKFILGGGSCLITS